MANNEKIPRLRGDLHSVKHCAKIIKYPTGQVDIIASSEPVFGSSGWEFAEDYSRPKKFIPAPVRKNESSQEDINRSMRRARSNLRRIALANDFRWFVTLTLDPSKVDSHSGADVVKKLNSWCSNMVQRKGLKYILVPERHKKGGIHFHGFFNDCLSVVDSGHYDSQGHKIFNLPQWSLGFTTAIELYDNYSKAVGYVCKYIGKQGEKPAGRWYYSGGDLNAPDIEFLDITPSELKEIFPDQAFEFYTPVSKMAVVNNIVLEEVQAVEKPVDNLLTSEVI